MIRINRILTGLLMTAVVGVMSSCSGDHQENNQNQDTPIRVTVSSASNHTHNTIQANGKIESRESAIISTRVMGFVTSVKVKAGDPVKKGQLLATISNDDILAKKAQAQAMITQAEAALVDAEKDFKRYEALYKDQSASTKEFENVTLRYNSIKANVEAARQQKKEADAMLVYTNLVAPFSGVVVQTMIDEGSMANPGMPILVVEQDGVFEATAFLTETDVVNVHTGAETEVVVKSSGKVMKGKVREVSPSSHYTGGQYLIKVSIPQNEKSGLYSGMVVQLSIQGKGTDAKSESMTLVPRTALIQKDQLVGVYTISENSTALLHWVRVGKTLGDQVQILSGLNVNEKFILQAEGKLYNGVPVQIQ